MLSVQELFDALLVQEYTAMHNTLLQHKSKATHSINLLRVQR
jgi:hypothetical protein